jgi:hypothetical protein
MGDNQERKRFEYKYPFIEISSPAELLTFTVYKILLTTPDKKKTVIAFMP